MDDWTLDSFIKTLDKANNIFGTPLYDNLVNGCIRAMKEECSWDIQFEKLATVLPVLRECND
jgi:hypothetical protein